MNIRKTVLSVKQKSPSVMLGQGRVCSGEIDRMDGKGIPHCGPEEKDDPIPRVSSCDP